MSVYVARLSVLVLLSTLAVASLCAYPVPQAPQTVRVGGDVKPPVKTKNVQPVYPPVARENKVQGVVMLDVTVGTDGKVKDIKVLRSIKGLDDAAVQAVRGWEYKPTLVNGQPAQVITTVPVVFSLE
jgi:periplasmic protein TonB